MSVRNDHDFEEKFRARYSRECFYGLTEVVLPALASAGSAVGSAAAGAGSAIGSGLGAVGSALGSAGSAIGTGLGSIGSTLGSFGEGALGALGSAGTAIGDFAGSTASDIGSALGLTGSTAAGPAASAAPAVGIGGGGSAAAVAPATSSLPVGSALDPTVAASLDPTAGVYGGGINFPTSAGGAGFFGGNASAFPGAAAEGSTAPTPAGVAAANQTFPSAQQVLAQIGTQSQPALQVGAGLNTAPAPSTGIVTGLTDAGGGGGGGFWDTSVGKFIDQPSWAGAGNILTSNPGSVASALGLGYNLMNRGSVQGLNALKTQSAAMQNQSQALENYLNTGTLPGGMQAGLDQSLNAAKQQIKSKYASLGMSGSTAEASDLAYANVASQAQKANLEMSLMQQGISEANMSSTLLNDIVGINQKQDQATGEAIAQFASALNGSPLQVKTNTTSG